MNLTATVPAGRRSSRLLQTQMIAKQFTTVVVDVTFISSLNGRPVPHPEKLNLRGTDDLGLCRFETREQSGLRRT